VRWQLLQKAHESLSHQPSRFSTAQQQQQPSTDNSKLLPALRVVGGEASDWVALEAGPLLVHVLTERARVYYNLEGLWGAPGRIYRVRVPSSEAAAQIFTKDTIR